MFKFFESLVDPFCTYEETDTPPKEISNFLNKKCSLDKTKELIAIKTRQYAKRQATWARGQMGSWEKINPKNLGLALKKLK